MKRFNLGDKVLAEKYYRPKGWTSTSENQCERYSLLDLNKEGIYVGKRLINVEGYSSYIGYEEGYNFVPVTKEQVHLVAINQKQLVYVPDEYIKGV